jgi:hypothetical protein
MKKPIDEKTRVREASFWKERKNASREDVRACRK